MSIKNKLLVTLWILFIITGITLAVNSFEQHFLYALIDKKYDWDYSFVPGLIVAGMGISQLVIFLKEK